VQIKRKNFIIIDKERTGVIMCDLTVTGKAVSPPDAQNKQNEPTQAKTIGFAIAIIIGIGGLAVAGVGVGGYLGAISGLNQVNSIIMIAAGGAGAITFLIVGIVGSVKNHSQKKTPPDTKTPKKDPEKAKEPEKLKKPEKTKWREKAKRPEKTKEPEKAKGPETEKKKEKEPEKTKGPETEKKKEPEKVDGPDKTTSDTPKQKEISFSDNTAKLYHRTSVKMAFRPADEVTIRPFKDVCPLAATGVQPHDAILLLGKIVLFSRNLGTSLIFSRAANTDHVIVDDAGQPGVYNITEVQTNGDPDKHWVVDTNKKFLITTKASNGKLEMTPVYLVESEVPVGYNTAAPLAMLAQHAGATLTRTLQKGAK
jgi:hypothetical protein